MPKYIRTEANEVLEVIEEKDCVELGGSFYYCKNNISNKIHSKFVLIHKDFVIKESDNLEDLFDEVVCFREDKLHCCYSSNLEDFKTMKKLDYVIEGSIFYGAVWVKDKGLIFVAKLNENEEWELIDNE